MPTTAVRPMDTDVAGRSRPDASRDRRLLLDSIASLLPALAHEIKNPLAVVQSAAELLSDASLDADAREDVDAIVEAVGRLRFIVDRYGALGEMLVRSPGAPLVDVVPSILTILAEQQRRFSRLGVEVRYDGPESCELRVSPGLLLMILDHLFRNAREATRAGDTIVVGLERSSSAFTLAVTDTGPGMSAAELARATDLFYSTKPGHVGIGLALTREIVERSGGELRLFSESGAGTQATIRVPLV